MESVGYPMLCCRKGSRLAGGMIVWCFRLLRDILLLLPALLLVVFLWCQEHVHHWREVRIWCTVTPPRPTHTPLCYAPISSPAGRVALAFKLCQHRIMATSQCIRHQADFCINEAANVPASMEVCWHISRVELGCHNMMVSGLLRPWSQMKRIFFSSQLGEADEEVCLPYSFHTSHCDACLF